MERNEDRAYWGDYADFVLDPDVSDDERQRRQLVVTGWMENPPTLWTITQEWWPMDRKVFHLQHDRPEDLFNARNEAGNHLALYLRERDGLQIWRAFRTYRQRGLPVPENILEKLDQWAARLETADSPASIAKAIEMMGDTDSKARGPERRRELERRRLIASRVELARELNEDRPADYRLTEKQIWEGVAQALHESPKRVERIHREWMAGPQPEKQRRTEGDDKGRDLQRVMQSGGFVK